MHAMAHGAAARHRLRFRIGFLTHVGRARERNEDAFAVWLPLGDCGADGVQAIVAVADGMGGHDSGDLASRTAAELVREAFAGPDARAPRDAEELAGWLEHLVGAANLRLIELGRAHRLARGMGCTLTIAVAFEGRLHLAHVGDSRCYRLRDGQFSQLTDDHSWVAEQHRAGLLTAEEARRHPQRNVLTRCLGTDPTVRPDLAVEALCPGDRLLLCSDGLHGPVSADCIAAVLRAETAPQAAVERLVALANAAGGPDNVTAAVLDVSRVTTQRQQVAGPADAPLPDTQLLPDASASGTRRAAARAMVQPFLQPGADR